VAVASGAVYEVVCVLFYNGPSGGTNGRLKVRLNFPNGALSIGHIGGINTAPGTTANLADIDLGVISNATSSPTGDFLMPTVGTGVPLTVLFKGTLVTSAAGNFSLDTAQIVASGTTTIQKHSRLVLRRLT
jgi:hypothetical protein